MFEEVPRRRTGLAGLTARRVVLGPFVVGGGVLLAAIGGSVAVAATVITASTISINDVPPRVNAEPHAPASSGHSSPVAAPTASRPRLILQPSASPVPGARWTAGTWVSPDRSTIVLGTPTDSRPPSSPPLTMVLTAPSGAPSLSAATSSPTGPVTSSSATGPDGNALIYLNGYDPAAGLVRFQFATVTHHPSGADSYSVTADREYSVSIAASIAVTSGGTVCPPAGSRCSVDQLIAATHPGFFAEVAIDADSALRSVIELDNAATASSSPTSQASLGTRPSSSAPTPTPTTSASPAATP